MLCISACISLMRLDRKVTCDGSYWLADSNTPASRRLSVTITRFSFSPVMSSMIVRLLHSWGMRARISSKEAPAGLNWRTRTVIHRSPLVLHEGRHRRIQYRGHSKQLLPVLQRYVRLSTLRQQQAPSETPYTLGQFHETSSLALQDFEHLWIFLLSSAIHRLVLWSQERKNSTLDWRRNDWKGLHHRRLI